ncbi:MAG TPA: acyltransferase family protein, partial [Acidimicrobiia bacterium]|nr:acyltransferase family protein [Acidimicrobiia bacterium]
MQNTLQPRPGETSGRDLAIDLIRVVAIGRVVVWHAFPARWLTFVAAVPLLFFVTGSLLARSRRRSAPRAVVLGRLRRLLPSVWLYGAVLLVAGAVQTHLHPSSAGRPALALRDVASWLAPLVDPRVSGLSGPWLTTHLWYIRAYVWVVLLAPVLLRLAGRLRAVVPFVGAGVVVLELAGHRAVPVLWPGPAHVVLGDALVYGLFALLGMAYEARRPLLSWRRAVAGATACALATAAFIGTFGLPAGGVNDSYPLIVFTGIGWLLMVGGAEPAIRRLAARRRLATVVAAVNRRAVTVYLWHPAAIMVAYAATDHLGAVDGNRWLRFAAVMTLTVACTAGAALVAGGAEDWAARRTRARPRRRHAGRATLWVPAASTVALSAVIVTLPLVPDPSAVASGVRRSGRSSLPPPSYRPALTDSAFARRTATGVTALELPQGLPKDRLDALLDQWLTRQPDVASVAVAIDADGHEWAGDAQGPETPGPTAKDDVYGVASVTKTFTLALVLRAVDHRLIDLDRPVPPLPGLDRTPETAPITPRHLL